MVNALLNKGFIYQQYLVFPQISLKFLVNIDSITLFNSFNIHLKHIESINLPNVII